MSCSVYVTYLHSTQNISLERRFLINLDSCRSTFNPAHIYTGHWSYISKREYIFLIYAACVYHYNVRNFVRKMCYLMRPYLLPLWKKGHIISSQCKLGTVDALVSRWLLLILISRGQRSRWNCWSLKNCCTLNISWHNAWKFQNLVQWMHL